jgi:hypothetical protein
MVQRLVAGGQPGGHPRGAQGPGGGAAQRPVAEPLADGRLGDAEGRGDFLVGAAPGGERGGAGEQVRLPRPPGGQVGVGVRRRLFFRSDDN